MNVSKPEAVAALYRVISSLYGGKEPNPVDIGLIRVSLEQLPGNSFPTNLK